MQSVCETTLDCKKLSKKTGHEWKAVRKTLNILPNKSQKMCYWSKIVMVRSVKIRSSVGSVFNFFLSVGIGSVSGFKATVSVLKMRSSVSKSGDKNGEKWWQIKWQDPQKNFEGGVFFEKLLFIAFLCDNFSKIPLFRQNFFNEYLKFITFVVLIFLFIFLF